MKKTTIIHRKSNCRNRAFTLVEVLIVVAIILGLAALGIPGYQYAMKRSEITSVLGAVHNIETAVVHFRTKPGGLRIPPVTESASATAFSLNSANATLAGAAAATLSKACTLDAAMLAEGFLAAPLNLKLGFNEKPAATAIDMIWDVRNNRYDTSTADTAPTADYGRSAHVECVVAAATQPATPDGTFFKVTPSSTMPTKARIVYLYVPGVPADRCADIANEKENTTDATTTTAKLYGPVTYTAPDEDTGLCNMFIYITHY
jgi:prepilin-type N-terminal cleavage/methylation domain-containing protein